MMRLTLLQWGILALPLVVISGFLLVAAGWQIHTWGLNWIWALVVLALVGWRWLLVRWTKPVTAQLESAIAAANQELTATLPEAETVSDASATDATREAEIAIKAVLSAAKDDAPLWQDWPQFWQRCQQLVTAIAHVYHPAVKYPLLNIYVPQAYALIRGTVDDLDQWMQKLSPVLGQMTVGQAYQGYELYQKLEPSARRLLQVWNWAQWLINPAAALAKQASHGSSDRATQQLMLNLSHLLREAALRNLARQAIALYSGTLPSLDIDEDSPPLPEAKTQTLQVIFDQAEPVEAVEQKPVNLLLVGRTGAGKSSLINTLFQSERAAVDVLPSTDQIQRYQWQVPTGEALTLWDTPGYEQVNRSDFREQVLDFAAQVDLLLILTPALDPALQMDVDFLKDWQRQAPAVPVVAVITQVDRLRPVREWHPPYDWQGGDRPKEISIREATQYRIEQFGPICTRVLPLVTRQAQPPREAWNADALSMALVELIDPAKQQRLARFLRDCQSRIFAAARIIDRYRVQMSTTQGLTALLKSPVLQFISTLTTGSPALAYVLAEQIPVEQLPIVIGKLQMAYDLYTLLSPPELPDDEHGGNAFPAFDLLKLWPLLRENSSRSDRTAWAFGHALVEYWTQALTVEQLQHRYDDYLQNTPQ
ncbi:MAG: GTPase [Cyanobacteria bacterium J06642_9]